MKEENKQLNKGKYFAYSLLFVLMAGAYGGMGYMYNYAKKLENKIAEQDAEIKESRKIYVYNMEDVLRGINAIELKTKFEGEIIKLNDELFAAEEKIKSLKDAKVKEDFSDMYLSNLKMKRDDLLAKYENNVKEITDKINAALAEITVQKHISAIFVRSALAVDTPDIEDITDEIIKNVKSK